MRVLCWVIRKVTLRLSRQLASVLIYDRCHMNVGCRFTEILSSKYWSCNVLMCRYMFLLAHFLMIWVYTAWDQRFLLTNIYVYVYTQLLPHFVVVCIYLLQNNFIKSILSTLPPYNLFSIASSSEADYCLQKLYQLPFLVIVYVLRLALIISYMQKWKHRFPGPADLVRLEWVLTSSFFFGGGGVLSLAKRLNCYRQIPFLNSNTD